MLENIRVHAKGWIAKVILALISIPFVLFGLDSYLKGDASDNVLVEVGDAAVSQQEFDQEIQNQTQRMRESLGERFDPTMAQQPEFRQRVLDALVERRVLALDAQKLKLYAPDSAVAAMIAGIDAFHENGVFSKRKYEAVLRQNGRTPAQFENELRVSLMRENLTSPVSKAAFAPRASAEQLALLLAQQREVSWHDISPAAAGGIEIKAAEVEAYYKRHAAEFTVPEAVQVDYVRLDRAEFAAALAIDEGAARDYYRDNSARLGAPEERSASHILIAVDKSAAPDVRARARARAERILQTLKREPGKFAALVQSESEDPVSAEQGGSLGTFGRGMMVKPVDEALFGMKPGELRGPVESDFGFHVLRLDSIKASGVAPFESVRDQVMEEMRQAEAQKRFPEVAEIFSNLVYENAKDLAPAAQAIKSSVRKSDWISAGAAPAPFDNPKLAKVVFAADAIKSRENIEAVEIEPGVLVSARVVGHRPASVRPLAEVSDAIVGKLRKERLAAATAKQADALIADLGQGKESGVAWTDFLVINRQMGGVLGADGVKAAFRIGVSKVPGYGGYRLPDGGYRVLRVSRVIVPPLPEPGVMKSLAGGIEQATQAADLQAWMAMLKKGHSIKLHKNLSEAE